VLLFLRRFGIVIAGVLLWCLFAIAAPETFPTTATFNTILSSQITLLLLAVAITMPLRTGDFDLSIGSIMTVSMILAAQLNVNHEASWGVSLIVSLIFGIAWGALNALLVVGFGINGLIATLGSGTVLTGIGYALTDSAVVSPVTGGLADLARTQVWGLPLGVYLGWAVALVLWIVFEFTPLGRYWLFAGGNAEAARLSGVRVKTVRVLAFVLSGMICGFAGVLLAGTNGAADPSIGHQYLLPPFAAAFLGTAAIQANRFNIGGTVVGIYLISSGNIGLALLGAPLWATEVFSGGVLVIAVGIARLGEWAAARERGRLWSRQRKESDPATATETSINVNRENEDEEEMVK
jgi:ribose transport system permease protein